MANMESRKTSENGPEQVDASAVAILCELARPLRHDSCPTVSPPIFKQVWRDCAYCIGAEESFTVWDAREDRVEGVCRCGRKFVSTVSLSSLFKLVYEHRPLKIVRKSFQGPDARCCSRGIGGSRGGRALVQGTAVIAHGVNLRQC